MLKYPCCQNENLDSTLFWSACSQSLKTSRICLQFSLVNPEDFKFCNKCIHALVEPGTPATLHFCPTLPNEAELVAIPY